MDNLINFENEVAKLTLPLDEIYQFGRRNVLMIHIQ